MDSRRAPHFFTDSSGRLTFDLDSVLATDFPIVCQAVATEFHLMSTTDLVVGLDQLFWDFRYGDQVIGMDWDNWMGFMVVAKTPNAEPLVRKIAAWMCSAPQFGSTGLPSE